MPASTSNVAVRARNSSVKSAGSHTRRRKSFMNAHEKPAAKSDINPDRKVIGRKTMATTMFRSMQKTNAQPPNASHSETYDGSPPGTALVMMPNQKMR